MAENADLGYTLSEDTVRRLARETIRSERQIRNRPAKRRRSVTPGTFVNATAYSTSLITARSNDTPGTGTVTILEIDDDTGDLADVEYTDLVDMTVYNISNAYIGSGAYLLVHRDRAGKWWTINSISQVLGKTDASHAKGASGTVSVWIGTAGSETDSTINITAYNRFAAVASGKWVWVSHNGYSWYLIAAEC